MLNPRIPESREPDMTATTAATSPRDLHQAGFLLHLLLLAILPLINALYFDWDAGLIAGLVIAEALLVLALLPLVWTALEWRQHRELPAAPGRPGHWPLRLLVNCGGGLLIFAVGGVLPTVFLSLLSPDWMEWASNHAVTQLGVPAVLTLVLWPFLLAVQIGPDWPSYAVSLAAVVLLTLAQMLGLCRQALSQHADPGVVEDEATTLLNLCTFPLFLMAALAYGIGGWLARERQFVAPLDTVDLAMWTLVLLTLARGLAGVLLRRAQQADRAWRRGRPESARQAEHGLRAGLGAGVALSIFTGSALLLLSEPRPRTPAPEALRADCVAGWPGRFAEASRRELDPDGRLAGLPAEAVCGRLLDTASLRLLQPIDPEDLARFQGLRRLELVGAAAVHAGDLDRLPQLGEVYFTRPGTLDLSTLRRPPGLTTLGVSEGRLRAAERLWHWTGVRRVMLQQVVIEEAARRPGRTRLEGLALSRVSGDLEDFLHGAIGLRELRLTEQPLASVAAGRLLHLRRLSVTPAPAEAEFCAAIARWHSVRGAAARACGHRHATPD